jgi:3-methyladenine DNA glycosylase/8-oxoguanine DNA glycosylase
MNDKPLTPKEYLSQAYRIDQWINAKLEQVMALRELATKATSTLSDMPRSESRNLCRMENIIVKIIGLEDEINGDIDRLVDLKREMRSVINAVESPEHKTLLELRYLCFKPWEQIAVDMGYSIQHVYRIHDQALNSVVVSKDESKCD